ncbi:MAG: 6-carboxyhexanoate--CoA ligase, partial [Negativicutes bacterium]|nr:6-carboxyhexanoate--CoA ligase [Negativicutes bacterium]
MLYTVRMRAAQGGAHESGGRHISGAERLAAAPQLAELAAG